MKIFFYVISAISGILLFESFILSSSGGEKLTNNPLNQDVTTIFSGSGNCQLCHTSNDSVNYSISLGDISATTLWQATMMANSARDPFWQAKISSETSIFPQLKNEIEDVCTKCHAPIGRTQAHYDDSTALYTLLETRKSPIALDGNSCTVCHQIKSDNFASPESYSGNYIISDERLIYGPYVPQYPQFMTGHVNYLPEFSSHLEKSELCATCHTLINEALDDNGNIVGSFFEQTNYIEWKNSSFQDQNVECQTCHLPNLLEPIVQSTVPEEGLLPRDTTHLHYLVGGNTFMLQLLKDNAQALEVTFTDESMDTTIARTFDMLYNQTIDMSVSTNIESDSLIIEVLLLNKTGHKFPTGYPARKAWIHLSIKDSLNNIYFESGEFDEEGNIQDEDFDFESHHDIITSDDQVQIYQQLAKDFSGNLTYNLLKSYEHIKDNRLVPIGFKKSDLSYDTVKIVGQAEMDPNFNFQNGIEGSGSDRIIYKVPSNLVPVNNAIIETEMLYQSINPRFAQHLFSFSTNEVQSFEQMYNSADKTPVVIARDIQTQILTSLKEKDFSISKFILYQNYPNPFNPATQISFDIPAAGVVELLIYDITGRLVKNLLIKKLSKGKHTIEFNGEGFSSGVYFYQLISENINITKKMILLR